MLRLLRSVVSAACDGVIHDDSGCDGDSGGDNDADSDDIMAMVVVIAMSRWCGAMLHEGGWLL